MKSKNGVEAPLSGEHEMKIDSLISVKSEGLLPDVHFEEDGFLFTETNRMDLPLSSNGFDFDAYKQSVNEKNIGFYEQLIGTQMFNVFIERAFRLKLGFKNY